MKESVSRPETRPRSVFAVASLLLANCLPIIGVLFFHWQVFDLFFLYWLESAVIGLFAAVKLIRRAPKLGWLLSIPLLWFYGFYLFVMFIFIAVIVGPFADKGVLLPSEYSDLFPSMFRFGLPVLLGFVVSHSISFVQNYLKKREYAAISFRGLLLASLKRVVFIHVALGAIVILASRFQLGSAGAIAAVFVKTTVDLISHLLEHRATDILAKMRRLIVWAGKA